MTIDLHLLRALYLGIEPAGSYSTGLSFPSGYLAFPYQEGSLNWSLMRRLGNPKTAKIYADGHDVQVLMQRRSKLSFSTALHSHGVDMSGVATAPTDTTWPLGMLMKALFGGMVSRATSGGLTTVQSGSTTTVINVTAGDGVDFPVDGVIACQTVPGSTALEAREIDSISTDAITVKEAFSAIPTTGTQVRGGVTFYPTEDPTTSLQAVIEGVGTVDRSALYGLQGGVKFTIPVGAPDGDGEVVLPTIGFELNGSSYARLGAQAAQALTSYAMYEPIANVASELTVPTFGTTTRVHVDEAMFTLELALAYAAITTGLGPGLSDNILRQRRQPSRPFAKGTFLTVLEDLGWEGHRDSRTVKSIFKQIGNVAGGGCLLSVPRAQIADAQPADDSSASGINVSFQGRHDNGSTELGRAAARAHFF